jgi:hypothetical protein
MEDHMIDRMTHRMVKRAFPIGGLSALVVVAWLGLSACAATDEPAPPNVDQIDQAIGNCCSTGSVSCPDGWESDYDPPGCGITHTVALSACKRHCGSSCVDHGWQPFCN